MIEIGCSVSPDDKNKITILFEWDSKDNFSKFAGSEDLKEAMKNAGVMRPPKVKFLD